MEKMKMIVAANIGQLRREAGLTQLDLAEKLNYSDKAVSKWERGESLPDVETIKQIADFFSVSVDYLFEAVHPVDNEIKWEYTKHQKRNHRLITAMSSVLVWLIATFVFVNVQLVASNAHFQWLCFIYAVPVTAIVLLVFNSIWGKRSWNFVIISVLLWSIITAIFLSFLCFLDKNILLIYIIGIPGQIIILLWAGIKPKSWKLNN